jgi:hypothetical protein
MMREGLGVVLVVIASGICLTALLLVLPAIFPKRVEATRRAAEAMPGRSLLAGAINLLFLGGVTLGLQALVGRDAPVPAVLGLSLLSIGVAIGLAAVSQLIGERLMPGRSHLRRSAWGAVLLILACLTPYVGWFLLFPYLALRGLGGLILGWFRGPAVPPTEA